MRNREIARTVLVDGRSIADLGAMHGIHQVTARAALHQYCRSANRVAYESLQRLKREVGGFKYYHQPLLKALRCNAESFFPKPRRYLHDGVAGSND